MWRKTKQQVRMKENKGERYTATTHSTTRNTQNSWKLYYIIPCRFFFFRKMENQLYRVLDLLLFALTYSPAARTILHYTILSNFLFCLSLFSGRRVKSRRRALSVCMCVYTTPCNIHTYGRRFYKVSLFLSSALGLTCVYIEVAVWSRETG